MPLPHSCLHSSRQELHFGQPPRESRTHRRQCRRKHRCSAAASALLADLSQTCSPEALSCAAHQLLQAAQHLSDLHASAPHLYASASAAADAGPLGSSMAETAAQITSSSHASPAFSLADAAAAAASPAPARSNDWLSPISNSLEWVLGQFKTGLDRAHVPYSPGWAIVALTLLTKTLTFPLTKAQVESALAVQNLKPTIDSIKAQYGEDKKRISRETTALYQKSGVNPLASLLPTFATIPIFWGLYRTLTNVTNEGLLDGGFYWIPSLSGPVGPTGANGNWLLPLVDGQPPIGWDAASPYVVLPVLLVIFQYISSWVIAPPPDPNQDEGSKRTATALNAFLPLLVGYFSINLPSGVGLYYFSNIIVTSGQQIYLRKLGGAQGLQWSQEIGIGQARRTGTPAVLDNPFVPSWKLQASSSEATTDAVPAEATVDAAASIASQPEAQATQQHAAASSLPPEDAAASAADVSQQDTAAASAAVQAMTGSDASMEQAQADAAPAQAVGVQLQGRICKRKRRVLLPDTEETAEAEQPQLVAA